MLNGIHELNGCLGNIDDVSFSWLSRDSLSADLFSLLLGLSLLGVVLSDSLLEGLSALALASVFNPDVDSLWYDSVTNFLVHNDTDSLLVDIEDLACLSMVEFVWHTLVDATIGNDINEISLSVCYHYSGEGNCSVVLEALGK